MLIVHAGQHFDRNMSTIFFEEMKIPQPDYCLDIHSLSHGAMTGRMIEGIEDVFLKEKPDMVLVYGDTNSTLAGALAAVKLHIPIAHVEAGLRSFNRIMPEEHNRVLTDHLSTFLFCPTRQAVQNLRCEGIGECPATTSGRSPVNMPQIFQVGDVMYDAALYYSRKSQAMSNFAKSFIDERLNGQDFALVTLHRQENIDDGDRLRKILSALMKVSKKTPIVWPVHPRTSDKLKEKGMYTEFGDSLIFRIDPVGYFDMIEFVKNCSLILTDSGGLQKEAYFFKKPCVTLREETEWVELTEHGFNRIVGLETDRIVNAAREMFEANLCFDLELYGSGDAGKKIVAVLSKAIGVKS